MNRYESPGTGRFLTTDPLPSSADSSDPGSWNRYAYVGGNRTDPSGLCDPFDPNCVGGSGSSSPLDPGSVSVDTCENLFEAAEAGDPVALALFGTYCNGFVPSAGGGGGAGGSPQGNSFATPNTPDATPALQTQLQNAIGLALNALATNPKCAKLLGTGTENGTTYTASQVLTLLYNLNPTFGSIGFGTVQQNPGSTSSATTQGGVLVHDGTTYNTADITLSTAANTVWSTGTPQQQAILLLHELGMR